MKTLSKPFDHARLHSRSGLVLLPVGGTMQNVTEGNFIEFSVAHIHHLQYNAQKRVYVGYVNNDAKFEMKAAHVILHTEKGEFVFFKESWAEGTAEAIQRMYKAALDGHDVDFRGYLGFTLLDSMRNLGPALAGTSRNSTPVTLTAKTAP